jgi:hypothetical protein
MKNYENVDVIRLPNSVLRRGFGSQLSSNAAPSSSPLCTRSEGSLSAAVNSRVYFGLIGLMVLSEVGVTAS